MKRLKRIASVKVLRRTLSKFRLTRISEPLEESSEPDVPCQPPPSSPVLLPTSPPSEPGAITPNDAAGLPEDASENVKIDSTESIDDSKDTEALIRVQSSYGTAHDDNDSHTMEGAVPATKDQTKDLADTGGKLMKDVPVAQEDVQVNLEDLTEEATDPRPTPGCVEEQIQIQEVTKDACPIQTSNQPTGKGLKTEQADHDISISLSPTESRGPPVGTVQPFPSKAHVKAQPDEETDSTRNGPSKVHLYSARVRAVLNLPVDVQDLEGPVIDSEPQSIEPVQQPLTFLTLPRDIREMILRNVLLFKRNRKMSWPLADVPKDLFNQYCQTIPSFAGPFTCRKAMTGDMWELGIRYAMPYKVRFSLTVSVLSTCKKLHDEGLRIFHHENEFVLLKNFGTLGRAMVESGGIYPVLDLNPEQSRVLPCMAWPPPGTKATPRLSFDLHITDQTAQPDFACARSRPGSNFYGPNSQIVPFSELATIILVVHAAATAAKQAMPTWKVAIGVQASIDLRPTNMYGLWCDFGSCKFIEGYVVPFLAPWMDFLGFTGMPKGQEGTLVRKAGLIRGKLSSFRGLPKNEQHFWYAERMAEIFDNIQEVMTWKCSRPYQIKAALLLFVRQVAHLLADIPEELDATNKEQAMRRMYRLLAIAARQIGHVASQEIIEIKNDGSNWNKSPIVKGKKKIALTRHQLLNAIIGERLASFADGNALWKVQSAIHIAYLNFKLQNDQAAHAFLRHAVLLSPDLLGRPCPQNRSLREGWADNEIIRALDVMLGGDVDRARVIYHWSFFVRKPVELFISAWYKHSGLGDRALEIKPRP